MNEFEEKAIDGKTSGMIGPGETVTWKARHFLVWHEMQIKITRFKFPEMFRDEMVTGPFASLRHDHLFETSSGGTIMTDVFHYTLPCGSIGAFVDFVLLRRHMMKLLLKRNKTIKLRAELIGKNCQ